MNGSAAAHPCARDLIPSEIAEVYARDIYNRLDKASLGDVSTVLSCEVSYPSKLGDARYPLHALYYRGKWDLVSTPSIAVVGARQLSDDGAARTRKLIRLLTGLI